MTENERAVVYREAPLPKDCPPLDSYVVQSGVYLRLVSANPCTTEDFKSGHAEQRNKPARCDDCTWKACSVWAETRAKEKLSDLAKLPNLSDKRFIAHVKLTRAGGRMKPHDRHVTAPMIDEAASSRRALYRSANW
jgi:hypothetical protein